MAEGMGFEPMNPCELAVFKTAAIDHSATPPHTGIVAENPYFCQPDVAGACGVIG